MRKLISILLSILMFTASVFCISGCDDVETTNHTIPDKTKGDMFEIYLKATGSIPYKWNYVLESNSGIEYVSSDFVPAEDSDRIGGGQLVYTFKAIKVGDYKIRFELCSVIESSKNSPVEVRVYKIKIVE